MKDETLGHHFNKQPDNEMPEDKLVNEDLDEETIAQAQKIIDSIEILKQMETIDSFQALNNVKTRIKREKKLNIVQLFQRAAAIILIPLLVFTFWQTHKLNNLKQNIVIAEISTPKTLRSVFTLPDGTQVWLNGGTTLKYPTRFAESERLVELDGEAYFKIAHNKNIPFLVKTGGLLVEAVGTEFNCNAYSSEPVIETVLTEGKINILAEESGNRNMVTTLDPGQMIAYNKEKQKVTRSNVDTRRYTAWRDGKIIFKNDRMDNVLNRLEHWYNVDFVIDPDVRLDYAFTGSFEGEELKQLLKYIELTTPVQFVVQKTGPNADHIYSKTIIEIKQKRK